MTEPKYDADFSANFAANMDATFSAAYDANFQAKFDADLSIATDDEAPKTEPARTVSTNAGQ